MKKLIALAAVILASIGSGWGVFVVWRNEKMFEFFWPRFIVLEEQAVATLKPELLKELALSQNKEVQALTEFAKNLAGSYSEVVYGLLLLVLLLCALVLWLVFFAPNKALKPTP